MARDIPWPRVVRPGARIDELEDAMSSAEGYDFVVVANRLPVDRVEDEAGTPRWRTSPGGLVAALGPVMRSSDGVWVGWAGNADETLDPFDADGIPLVPVPLSTEEVARFYEGFSNATLWPLYHDVIVSPEYHREWWEAYQRVNERFARAAAEVAAAGATIWVHDYQLQLVPALVRQLRPDVRIGFFGHIPFPPYELFAQLPWRSQILRGLLGADLVGFQTDHDARSFLRACREALGLLRRGGHLRVSAPQAGNGYRPVRVGAFPISVDTPAIRELAAAPEVDGQVRQIRTDLGGDGRQVVLGVDRLDYTKGIGHRLKAYAELLDEGRVDPAKTVLVQVAVPSRERVEEYRRLRDEIELTVGRINGLHGTIGQSAVVYLHQSHDRSQMATLYRLADVMLVTPLRDGMNLVAKEYVASRVHDDGVLVLSEFAGAANQLRQALIVNPHDIAGVKDTIVRALAMPRTEQRSRMRRLRRVVQGHPVQVWAQQFLAALGGAPLDTAR